MSLHHSVRSSVGVLCMGACALALDGCASLKVTPQNYQVVQSPVTVKFDAGSDIVPNTATASIDGQAVSMSCTQYACTSVQPVGGLTAGIHTILASVQETCATCNPNPITLNNDPTPNSPPTPPPHPETQFVVDYAMSLSPSQLSIQQGQSGALTLTDSPILNMSSNLSATGASGITLSPGQASAASGTTGLTLSVASSVPAGSYTITIQQQPVGSNSVPSKSGTVNLTVTAIPPTVQTGNFVEATFACGQFMGPNGQLTAKCGPGSGGSNAPNAPNTVQFFTSGNQSHALGSLIGFYNGGGAAFCPASNYGAVMTPVPLGSNLGTNAQVIYFLEALPNPGASLPRYVAYTNGSGGATALSTLWFSPDCGVVMVQDIDPSVAGSRQLRAQFYKTGLISPFYTVHYNSSVSASVINGGTNGEVQVKADNGSPTTAPIQ